MKHPRVRILVSVAASLLTALLGRAGQPEYVEGEVIVTFKPSVNATHASEALAQHGLGWQRRFSGFSQMWGKESGLIRSKNQTTTRLIAELSQNPDVEAVEPNYLHWVTSLTPNDTYFSYLWGLQNTGQALLGTTGTAGDDIRFLPAWSLAKPVSTNPPVVAVIDTGVDYTHPDLAGNMWINAGENPTNGLDNDHDGLVNDYYGYDFADNLPDPQDSGDHGTHVAGTIAAIGNNGMGVIGVDYQAKIMALRASSDGSSLPDSAIIEAIQYAVMKKTNGVNIVAINESFGGGGYNSTERAAMITAGNAGIIFCVAAGNSTNSNDLNPTYPANYRLTNMIVVAASDQNDGLAWFSNYGTNTVDIAAPGVSILSALPVNHAGSIASVLQGSQTYAAYELQYAGRTTSNGLTATVYDCGLGYSTNFPKAVSNNIALIQRGTLTFSNKVVNAMKAGAQAVIIYNNTNTDFSGFTLGATNHWIPAVAISQTDGQAIQTNTLLTVFNIPDPSLVYQYLDGTSMATPHVSGAVAFAAMNFPSETVTQRVQRVLANADVVTNLSTAVHSGRRLNLRLIVDTDGNNLPDWWELQYFGQLTGTDPNADADHDGLSNLGEWLAGTSPTNAASGLWLTVPSITNSAGVVLRWPSVAGKTYRIERATNLLSGFTAFVRTNIAATAPMNTETDAIVLPGTARFYRIGVEP